MSEGKSPMAEALCAAGPNVQHRDKLMQFGRLVGSWSLDVIFYDEAGRVSRRSPGEWHFGWCLEGRAIADVWIVPPRAQRDANSSAPGEYGATLRFYDPVIDAWHSTWHGPVNRIVWPFIGRQEGSDMVLARTQDDGSLARWIFGDITDRSFRWRAMTSIDNGRTWRLTQQMLASRMSDERLEPA